MGAEPPQQSGSDASWRGAVHMGFHLKARHSQGTSHRRLLAYRNIGKSITQGWGCLDGTFVLGNVYTASEQLSRGSAGRTVAQVAFQPPLTACCHDFQIVPVAELLSGGLQRRDSRSPRTRQALSTGLRLPTIAQCTPGSPL